MGRKRKQQDSKDVKLMKAKLRLYGEYTKKIEELEWWKKKLNTETELHADYPLAAAKACGLYATDPDHPPTQRLTIETTSVPFQLKELEALRSGLGLDDWIKKLSDDNYKLIWLIYVDEYSQEEAGRILGLSREGARDRIDAICKSPPAGG